MAVTVSVYNHTVSRFANGANAVGDTYKINLYSALTFNAAHTTKAAVDAAATQLSTANGYTQDTKELGSVAVNVVTTNDANFDAADVQWTASGGDIGPASYAMIYNDTDADDPPVAVVNFGEAKTAGAGTTFNITWNASGIFTFTIT
jgi:hypothetical protein